SGPAPMNHLVVAPAPAEITGPATPAGFLPVDVAFRQPRPLPLPIDALADIPHGTCIILDEAMAREQTAGRRNAEIPGPGAARIGPVRPAVNLFERRHHVGERIGLACRDPAFKLT